MLRGASGIDLDVVGKVRLKVGEGITGWVAREETAVALSSEPWLDKRFKPVPNLVQDKFQSMLSVPLRGQENLVGVINVRTNPPHEYTSTQIGLLDSIARQVGGAVENYTQYRRMEQRASQLSTLVRNIQNNHLGPVFGGNPPAHSRHDRRVSQLQDLLDHAPRRRQEGTGHQGHAEQKPRLHEETQRESLPRAWPDARLWKNDRSLCATSARPRDINTPTWPSRRGSVRWWLCRCRSRTTLSACSTVTRRSPHQFSEEEINVLTALANQAAISIQNAKLMVQSAVLQEMHHRVKNSLQTIASLLRLQIKVGKFDKPREALNHSMNRIQSIAAVHELLSRENLDDVSIRRLADNILSATAKGLLPDVRKVSISVQGDDFLLPSGQATYVALVLNELIQNAVEHGLKDIGSELIVRGSCDDDSFKLEVINDGEPLPSDFEVRQHRNLGLRIVESLVRDNLMGEFSIISDSGKTTAKVTVPAVKRPLVTLRPKVGVHYETRRQHPIHAHRYPHRLDAPGCTRIKASARYSSTPRPTN